MKKFIILSVLTSILLSCNKKDNFSNSNIFYESKDEDYDVVINFIEDTIVAFNTENLKTCGWIIKTFEKRDDGLYSINELKTDTLSLKFQDGKLAMFESGKEILFQEIDNSKEKIDSLKRQLELEVTFIDKGIIYTCDFSLKEAGYFYEKAIREIQLNLKNPNSAKFNKVFIHKYDSFNEQNEFAESTATVASVDVEAKNGLGNYIESDYHVFYS